MVEKLPSVLKKKNKKKNAIRSVGMCTETTERTSSDRKTRTDRVGRTHARAYCIVYAYNECVRVQGVSDEMSKRVKKKKNNAQCVFRFRRRVRTNLIILLSFNSVRCSRRSFWTGINYRWTSIVGTRPIKSITVYRNTPTITYFHLFYAVAISFTRFVFNGHADRLLESKS